MKRYIRRTSIIFTLLVLITLLLTVYGIFFPMKKEIELNVLDNFNLLSETKIDTFMSSIDKSVQGAKSLSSRTVIRNKIVEYLEGDINFEDLKNFTQDKYLDGVKAIENVAYAVRIVDNKVVSAYYDNPEKVVNINRLEFNNQVEYDLILKDSSISLEVISPIFNNQQIIGYDLVGYGLDGVIELLNRDEVKLAVSEKGLERKYLETHTDIFEDASNIYYVQGFDEQYEMIVYQSKDRLFSSQDNLTRRSIIFIVSGYLFIFLIIYLFVINYSKKMIQDLSMDRDLYKNHADRDTLTGANTRLFFNSFVEKHPFESGLLILIDLDHFKKINDIYGHSTGDEVLKTVVTVFKTSIRSDDLVIRYGGDEFILFLRKNERNDGLETIKRIKTELYKQKTFEFAIEFSYGISFVESMEHIDDNIKEADAIMYGYKQKSK